MFHERKPDRLEHIVRFVCGVLAGGILGACASMGADWPTKVTLAIIAVAALVFGGCAAAFGDDFWRTLGRLLSWW